MIISVAHLKGGTGKTTTAAHLLNALGERGDPVAGIDADTQGSLVGEGFPIVEVAASPQRLSEIAARYRQVYEHVVIDAPQRPGSLPGHGGRCTRRV